MGKSRFYDFGGVLGGVESEQFGEETYGDAGELVSKSNREDDGSSCSGLSSRSERSDSSPGSGLQGARPIPFLIRCACLGIAACGAIVSGVNAYEYFRTIRPTGMAILTAAVLVGSGAILPDISLDLGRNKHRVLAALVAAIGGVAIALCMVTTLAALYNTRTERTAATYASDSAAREAQVKSNQAMTERSRLVGELEQVKELIASTQRKVDSIPVEDTLSDTSQVLIGRLNKYLKEKKAYEDRIASLSAIESAPAPAISHRADFYTFLANIFHANSPDEVEFLIGAIPAMFLELITPLMIAVALFI